MNISFSEYVKLNMDKAYNHQKVEVPDEAVKKAVKAMASAPVKEKDAYDFLQIANPDVWTARIVKNDKYLFHGGRCLDITKLSAELKALYAENGYRGYGFSKLTESDLIRYTTVREILANAFGDINQRY